MATILDYVWEMMGSFSLKAGALSLGLAVFLGLVSIIAPIYFGDKDENIIIGQIILITISLFLLPYGVGTFILLIFGVIVIILGLFKRLRSINK